MNKPLLVISCPIDVFSGYSARSRDLVKVLLRSNKYDIKILSQRWGSCPFGFLDKNKPEDKQILDCILIDSQLPKQPDVWIQHTVPNEFQAIGKFNIGITAGIETTLCDASWIEGVNRMDLTLVSADHAKKVFESSTFEQRDKNTNQLIKTIKLEKPVEVLIEGLDTEIYRFLADPRAEVGNTDLYNVLDDITEDFNFLFVGHWMQGELGQDRKDVGMLIKTFLETFRGKGKKPGLILKTSASNYSIMDREEILSRIQKIRASVGDADLPNIYLLHGELSDNDMNSLYNHPKVKAHVSFTKGEGYGRPLLEASVSQKPVIVSGWSGHMDFIKSDMSVILPGSLTQIHPSAVIQNMLLAESSWFTVDYKTASGVLKDVYKDPKKFVGGAKKQAYLSRTKFSLEKMGEKLLQILDNKIPKQVQIKLPQLIKR